MYRRKVNLCGVFAFCMVLLTACIFVVQAFAGIQESEGLLASMDAVEAGLNGDCTDDYTTLAYVNQSLDYETIEKGKSGSVTQIWRGIWIIIIWVFNVAFQNLFIFGSKLGFKCVKKGDDE